MVAFCAEFPNDNPALHDGAIFVVTTVDGQWTIERPSSPRSIEALMAAPVEATPEEPASPTPLFVLEPVLGSDDEGADDEDDVDDGLDDIDDHCVLQPMSTAFTTAAAPETNTELAEAPTETVAVVATSAPEVELALEATAVSAPEVEPALEAAVAPEVEPALEAAAAPEVEPAREAAAVSAPEVELAAVSAEAEPTSVALEAEPSSPVAEVAMEVATGETAEELAVEEWDYSEWQGTLLEGPPVALAPLESAVVMAAAAVLPEDEELVVEPLEPFVPTETYTTSELPPASDDPFSTFVMAIADACLASQELSVAALLPALLFRGRVEPGQADDDAVRALVATGVLEPDGDAWVVGKRLGGEVEGWKAILRGTSDDLGPCGPLALDEWSAHLAALLCAKPEKETALRREIRSRGVAAFGLVEAAA